MSSRIRIKVLSQTPLSAEKDEVKDESSVLQQELQTLKQIHSSIKALNHLTVTLHKTLESVVKNHNQLKDLNEGWQIFFGQR